MITRYPPIGVVGAVVPWNFAILLAVWKIAPALVAGCTIIVKPSPFTPLCDLKMVELLQELVPPGVCPRWRATTTGEHVMASASVAGLGTTHAVRAAGPPVPSAWPSPGSRFGWPTCPTSPPLPRRAPPVS